MLLVTVRRPRPRVRATLPGLASSEGPAESRQRGFNDLAAER